jgi:hypothetical protein
MALEPVLTPHGLLTLRETGEAPALEPEQGLRLEKAFARLCSKVTLQTQPRHSTCAGVFFVPLELIYQLALRPGVDCLVSQLPHRRYPP